MKYQDKFQVNSTTEAYGDIYRNNRKY